MIFSLLSLCYCLTKSSQQLLLLLKNILQENIKYFPEKEKKRKEKDEVT
jgi:hypothetical protein